MVNLTALQNITPIDLNVSLINDTSTMIPQMVANVNTQTDNWFGLIVMMGVYIWLFWLLFNDTDRFRLDIIKTNVFASGITLIVGVIMIVSGLTTTFTHVLWFGSIFSLSMIASYFLKQKGG